MEKHERTDRTFPIFLIFATIFMVVLMVVTFPRHEGTTVASSAPSSPAKK